MQSIQKVNPLNKKLIQDQLNLI